MFVSNVVDAPDGIHPGTDAKRQQGQALRNSQELALAALSNNAIDDQEFIPTDDPNREFEPTTDPNQEFEPDQEFLGFPKFGRTTIPTDLIDLVFPETMQDENVLIEL